MDFCLSYEYTPLPADEDTILLYISYLYLNDLRYNSIRVYISAIRSLHVESGFGNPLESFLLVKQALRSLQINSDTPNQKLPITLSILRDLYSVCNGQDPDSKMMWAALTLAFYGCLRASEFTVDKKFNSLHNLTMSDVEFHSNEVDHYMSVRIKRSKTDYSNKGFLVNICCIKDMSCAVCAMKRYLECISSQHKSNDPLFQFIIGVPLLNRLFKKHLSRLLALKHYPINKFSGHSLRIGCATTAAAVGLQDWQIKLLGRWTSDAYQRYIRAPIPMVLQMSKQLIQVSPISEFYNYRNPYTANAIN